MYMCPGTVQRGRRDPRHRATVFQAFSSEQRRATLAETQELWSPAPPGAWGCNLMVAHPACGGPLHSHHVPSQIAIVKVEGTAGGGAWGRREHHSSQGGAASCGMSDNRGDTWCVCGGGPLAHIWMTTDCFCLMIMTMVLALRKVHHVPSVLLPRWLTCAAADSHRGCKCQHQRRSHPHCLWCRRQRCTVGV